MTEKGFSVTIITALPGDSVDGLQPQFDLNGWIVSRLRYIGEALEELGIDIEARIRQDMKNCLIDLRESKKKLVNADNIFLWKMNIVELLPLKPKELLNTL